MSFRSSTILTGSALGLLLTLGTLNNASAGSGGYGYAPMHGHGAYHGYHMAPTVCRVTTVTAGTAGHP